MPIITHGGTHTERFSAMSVMFGITGSKALAAEQFRKMAATAQSEGEMQFGPGTHGGSAACSGSGDC